MEFDRRDPHPFKTLIDAKRKDLALSRIERPMTQGCEDAYVEAMKVVRELDLPGIGLEAYMFGIIREWNGVRFIYDTRPDSYPDREAIERGARAQLKERVWDIKAEWNMTKAKKETLTPGTDHLATRMFDAEQSAIAQRFPEITTGNMFEAVFRSDSYALTVALGGIYSYREILDSLGR